MVNRAVLAHRLFTGISRDHLSCLVEELAQSWQAAVEGRRHEVRGGARKRAAGAGARHQLVFVDRLVATLIHLRHDLPHSVLGLLFGVVLRTLADVFAYAQAEGVGLRLDATEVQIRRAVAGRGGRRAFVSGEKKQNTMKSTVIADHRGRTLWTDALRPGRMHDVTAARNKGIATCLHNFPDIEVLMDDGYPGLRRAHPGQAITPPRKPNKSALPPRSMHAGNATATHTHPTGSPSNTPSPTTNAGSITRWTHRRDRLPATYQAIAGLVSDRTAII